MMDFFHVPDLEHIALVKIAAILWQQYDIRALITKLGVSLLSHKSRRENWKKIENRVIKNALKLPQPELFKQKVLSFIKPLGIEVLKWITYHHQNSHMIDLPSEFFWTSQGTIDRRKTAEAFIREERIDAKVRYNLACIYCLEEHIQELWFKIPEDRRNIFHDTEDPVKIIQRELVYLWTNDLYRIMATADKLSGCRFQISSLTSVYAFKFAVTYRNKAAMEYFLPKLTLVDRDEALVNGAKAVLNRHYNDEKKHDAEVLCFLLSHMKELQKTEIIENNALKVLECFLDWPLQHCFVENASFMLNFISRIHCICLLELIADKVLSGFKDFDYLNLFRDFWSQVPEDYKSYIIDEAVGAILLPELFQMKDVQFIKVFFQDLSATRKKCVIFGKGSLSICKNLICNDEWDLLEFFIGECISTKYDMLRFKKRLEDFITKDVVEKKKNKWDNFFLLFDVVFCESDAEADKVR